jgi:hypothetical protein
MDVALFASSIYHDVLENLFENVVLWELGAYKVADIIYIPTNL